jgi:hypothetical protein
VEYDKLIFERAPQESRKKIQMDYPNVVSSQNFVQNIFTTHVNPRKLLEKSRTKSEEILDQQMWYQVLLGRRCSINYKKNIRFGITFFFGFWPNFLGLLGIG